MSTRGTWTEDAIVYAVKNDIEGGMRTTSDYSFSLEHLRLVVYAVRSKIIQQLKLQGALQDKLETMQEINCIELDCENFSLCKNIDSKDPALHFKIPHYLYLDYIGLARQDGDVSEFKIHSGKSSKYNKYRNKKLVERPYVRLRNYANEIHGFIFNPPTSNMKFLSVRGAFENPRLVNQYSCCTYNPREDRFPMPDYMVDQLIQEIVGRWSQIYKNFNRLDVNNNPALKDR